MKVEKLFLICAIFTNGIGIVGNWLVSDGRTMILALPVFFVALAALYFFDKLMILFLGREFTQLEIFICSVSSFILATAFQNIAGRLDLSLLAFISLVVLASIMHVKQRKMR